MIDKTYCFDVAGAHLDAFSSALVLATLEAMRAGHWSLDAGIWSLGRPSFRLPLEHAGVHPDLAMVLREADELSALAALAGRAAADLRLDELIAAVRARVLGTDIQPWEATVHER